jgi:hypothetical protein
MAEPAGAHLGDCFDAFCIAGAVPDLIHDALINSIQQATENQNRRLPHDSPDRGGDQQSYDRIDDWVAQPCAHGAGQDCQTGPAVHARMMAIGDQRGAMDLLADPEAENRNRLVADKADNRGDRNRGWIGQRLWMY